MYALSQAVLNMEIKRIRREAVKNYALEKLRAKPGTKASNTIK